MSSEESKDALIDMSSNNIEMNKAADMKSQEEVERELVRLRKSIDNIDAALVSMLAERFKATQIVGHLKAEHHMPPSDPSREVEQIKRLRVLAQDADLDPEFAEKFLNFIITEVIQHHKIIAQGS